MASGAVSGVLVGLRSMIAGLAAFRAWCGIVEGTEEEQQAAAEARVHLQEAPVDAARPRVLLMLADDVGGFERVATATLAWSGEVLLAMEHELAEDLDGAIDETTLLAFTDAVGGVLEGLGLAGEAGAVHVRSIRGVASGISDPDRASREPLFLYSVHRVAWGMT